MSGQPGEPKPFHGGEARFRAVISTGGTTGQAMGAVVALWTAQLGPADHRRLQVHRRSMGRLQWRDPDARVSPAEAYRAMLRKLKARPA